MKAKDEFVKKYLSEFQPAIERGSLGFLSIMKGELLVSLVENPELLAIDEDKANAYYSNYSELRELKRQFFNYVLDEVQKGDLGLIPQLAKGITSNYEAQQFFQVVTSNNSYLLSSVSDPLLVYPGTFDPMHYGHRILLASLLGNLPHEAQITINVNYYHARKVGLELTHLERFANLEYRTMKSNLIDPYKVTAMDFKFGAKPGDDFIRQTEMQTSMAGADHLRWVIGGDKFLAEVERAEHEMEQAEAGRSLTRFNLKDFHIYIVPRKGQNWEKVKTEIKRCQEIFQAQFILVEELAYDSQPISSTLIRNLRNSDKKSDKEEINKMELSDLTREYL